MQCAILLLGVAVSLGATAGIAQQIANVPYAELRAELMGRVDFEFVPQRPEPGFNFDNTLYSNGVWLGEHFAGQNMGQSLSDLNAPHDVLTNGNPTSPLSVRSGTAGQNLSIAFHRGFASNALFPLGANGFPDLSARGEGAVAVLFETDQSAVGLRVHLDYDAPLNAAAEKLGVVTVKFFNRTGQEIETIQIQPDRGVHEYGFRRVGNIGDIAGLMVLNLDPGGIAVDDILFNPFSFQS